MKKTVNLADRKEAMELLKQLYGPEKEHDESESDNTERESGAESTREVVKLPPNCS